MIEVSLRTFVKIIKDPKLYIHRYHKREAAIKKG